MFNRYLKFQLNSKAKLERIESLVICHHNTNQFNSNLLRHFSKLKNLYISDSSFSTFTEKLPKLEHLEVSLFA